jgi:Zn-dependent peptidase ImmA (M78 family)
MPYDPGERLQTRKRPADLAALAPKKERANVSRAAAAYDTQERDLITKTKKIIAASNRALREAEAVLKRR